MKKYNIYLLISILSVFLITFYIRSRVTINISHSLPRGLYWLTEVKDSEDIEKGDIVIGISTSGNSPNVIRGLERAKEKGAVTVGMTGQNPNEIEKIVNYCLKMPSTDTPRIQEGHITVGHIICYLVEEALFE